MIEIEYIVRDHQGVERLRTADKKAADAYDKALDIADRLARLLRDEQVAPDVSDDHLEELTIYIARNARLVERILKGKDVPSPDDRRTPESVDDQSAEDDRAVGHADGAMIAGVPSASESLPPLRKAS